MWHVPDAKPLTPTPLPCSTGERGTGRKGPVRRRARPRRAGAGEGAGAASSRGRSCAAHVACWMRGACRRLAVLRGAWRGATGRRSATLAPAPRRGGTSSPCRWTPWPRSACFRAKPSCAGCPSGEAHSSGRPGAARSSADRESTARSAGRATCGLGEPWAVLYGPLLLVGDAKTAFGVEAASGAGVWEHRVTGVGAFLESRRHLPRRRGAAPHAVERPAPRRRSARPVAGAGGRMVALDALTGDGLWHVVAPGAAFGMPAPRGTIHSTTAVGEDRLIAQVSGPSAAARRGQRRASSRTPRPCSRRGHTRRPTSARAGVAAIGERNTLDVFDAATGKVLWRRRLVPSSLLSGEPPSRSRRGNGACSSSRSTSA